MTAVAAVAVLGLAGSFARPARAFSPAVQRAPGLAAVQQPDGPAMPNAPGVLSITAPATATLPATLVGRTTSAKLGTVTVDDSRTGSIASNWTATVSATAFTSGATVIPLANVTYWSGPGIACSGTGTFIPGQLTAAQAVNLTTTRVAFTHTSTSAGTSICSWTPTVTVSVPLSSTLGTYTAVITHSVTG